MQITMTAGARTQLYYFQTIAREVATSGGALVLPPSVFDSTLMPKFGQPAVALPPCHRSGLTPRHERRPVYGERTMAVVSDLLLGSCVFAFVTGIVIAAANLLI
jgi:hypothetical protein